MPSPASVDEKDEVSDRDMRRQLWTLLAAMLVAFLIAVLAYSFFLLNAEVACYFASNKIYMGIWPPNLRDADVLLNAGYPAQDSCILLSTRSMIGAVMLLYIVYLFISQVWVRDRRYIPKLIPISAFLIFGYMYVSTKAISTGPATFYSISTSSGVAVNIIKSYVKICGLYLGVSLLVQRIFALLRLKYNLGRGFK
ncbi:hypothetical protein EV281_108185 [Rhizobium sp. BK418]|nr:hypothetical protein EV281_108185 [Rhizobium sp. BK418]